MLSKQYPYIHNDINEKVKAMEAIDEILINLAKTSQITIDIPAKNGAKIRKVPAEVATPFPPLNPSQIG